MANLVPAVNTLNRIENRILEFKGLNRRSFVQEGEMSDMLNLSSDDYPLLSPRKPRGNYTLPQGVVRPIQIMARYNHIAMIALDDDDNVNFYYNGQIVPSITDLGENTSMVAINTKICFFPEKKYVELVQSGSTVTVGATGDLEASVTVTGLAVTRDNVDTRITLSSGHGFKYDDALNFSGTLTYTPAGGTQTTAAATASCIIEQIVNNNTLVLPRETFIEMTGEGATNITFTGTISRTMPHLDHVIEWNNRLWGASNLDNTIYACKLGDPTNWQYYQGTGLDSYYAQQGTDGIWTGVATYSGHIIFFKQNGMCRVYGTAPSNYQITNAKCFGVEEGSRLSVVTVNDVVYYKSVIGIMAYAGSTPVCISENLGSDFRNVIAGSEGQKYYASCQKANGGYELLVYDIGKGVWHKEDDLRFRNSCAIDNRLYFIEYNDDQLYCGEDVFCSEFLIMGGGDSNGTIGIINPVNADENVDELEWMATFGPFDEYIEEHKIYSKLALRFKARGPASVSVYISEDEGPWENVKDFTLAQTGGEVVPILPRRCDRYSVKVEGTGNCEIVSLTRRVRRGTFGKL